MIHKAFQQELSARWEEAVMWDSLDQKQLFTSKPLPLAFSELEYAKDEGDNGEVIIAPELKKHWDVIMREYSISRTAAEVLLFMSRQDPLVIKVRTTMKQESVNFIVFKEGLDELVNAGVVDIRTTGETCEYKLSHDLLASVVLGRDFGEMWKDTQKLRSTRRLMEEYRSSQQPDDDF